MLQTEVQAILCGHIDEHTLVYVIPWEGTATDPELQWMEIQDVTDQQLQLFMSLAICTSFSFAPPPYELSAIQELLDVDSDWNLAQQQVISLAVHLGARLPKHVVSKHLPSGGSQQLFEVAVARDKQAADLLSAAIHAQAQHVDAEVRESYLAWADCIKPLPVSDIPSQMYQEMDGFTDPQLGKI